MFKLTLKLLLLFTILFACGCNPPKAAIGKFNEFYTAGQYDQALALSQSYLSKDITGRGDDLLWCLNAASTCRAMQQPQKSNEYFEHAETILNRHEADRNKTLENIGGSILNDNIVAYTGKVYDGIMTNVYKAINYMIIKDNASARVEFNRAADRQRRAVDYYNKELAAVNKAAQEKEVDPDDDKYTEVVSQYYSDLDQYEVYNNFVNPFASYMAGLFFYLQGDYNKSVDLLKETAGMTADNEFINDDFDMAQKAAFENNISSGNVWIIYENGLGPTREELKFGLPIPVNDTMIFIQIALPKLEHRNLASANLIVNTSDSEIKTQQIASVDRIVQTEFKKEFAMALTRAIISATAKAVVQYSVRDKEGVVQLLALAGSIATTSADVRMWTSLPKDFQVAKVKIPDDDKISVTIPGCEIKNIELNDCRNAIVYVSLTTVAGNPKIDVIKF